MPDLTAPFSKVFDVIRLVSRPITSTSSDPLRLYGDDGQLLDTLTEGWFTDELTQEQTFERILELHVTHRDGVRFEQATFFGFGGYKYERVNFPNPPVNNPREWVWQLKPVGVDDPTN